MLYSLLFEMNALPFGLKLIIFFTFTLAVVIALTIHEFAHAFTAYKLGDGTAKLCGRLSLNPVVHFDTFGLLCFIFLGFGWAKPVPINSFNFKHIKRDTFLVSIAGVVINLIIAFISYPCALLFLSIIEKSVIFQILYYLFMYLFQANLIFAVFNLLPIYPLDGFNALASQLKYTNPFVTFMQRYGSIVLLFAIIFLNRTGLFNLLVYYVGYPISKLWSLIFFGF